ncbi:MAG: calcineurin-like phosphoesterase C-terminal domain-containing protein [Pirellulaceae bacterium]|nr:calcineurin-like phosphoesterase C-terminal domain-containing protein [Pirellulaceae bacterium]
MTFWRIGGSVISLLTFLGVVDSVSGAEVGAEPTRARGVVFHDANDNQVFDQADKPLAGIRVSNGREIATTNESGQYELTVDDDTILFVLKPRGWRTPLDEANLPRFYYIHKPNGSPESQFPGVAPTGPLPASVDFPLYPQDEPDKFQAVLFGDTQPRDKREIEYLANDVVQELIGTKAAFGVTLGDIVFDNLDLLEPMAQTIGVLGIPWYNVIGNHDLNFEAQHDRHSDETFERVFGPPYYSFDYGPTHFLVLDDVEWLIDSRNGRGTYRGGIGTEQLEFIRNDLAGVPDDQLVVLMMHIPLPGVQDRQELYRLIEKRRFCISISGHTHTHEHRFITRDDGWQGPEPHHHIVNVTACGSWWRGAPDERGIPHATMTDGGPNGYSVITFDGTDYTLDYKAAGRDRDYQMQIHAPGFVSLAEASKTEVLVNVFNGSQRSTVEMSVDDGQWITMKQAAVEDPAYRRLYDIDQQLADNPWIDLSKPHPSTHIWAANLPDGLGTGLHLIKVRTVDMHGREFTAKRIFRIERTASP